MDEAERPDGSTDHLRLWRRRYVRILVLAGGGGLVLGWVGLLVGRATGDGPHRSLPWWVTILVLVGPLVLLAVTASLAWRRQSRSGPPRQLMQISTPTTAREVGRALKLGQALDERQRQIAQATVDGWQRRRWVPWFFAIGACFYVAEAFIPHRNGHWLLNTGVGLIFFLNAVLQFRTRRTLLRRAAKQGIRPSPTHPG